MGNSENEILHSQECERMTLGSMLHEESAVKHCTSNLTADDFHFKEHKLIFKAICSLNSRKQEIRLDLLAQELKESGKLENAGGILKLTELEVIGGGGVDFKYYTSKVLEKSKRRCLLRLIEEGRKEILSGVEPCYVSDELTTRIKKLEQCKSSFDKFPIEFLSQKSERYFLEEPPCKPMLLESIDDKPVGFLPKGIVSMLVGAGGVGKSHLLAQLAISISTGTPFLEQFTTTELCGENRKGSVFLGLGENDNDDIQRLLFKASKKIRQDTDGRKILIDASKRIAPFSFCGQQAAFLDEKRPSRYFHELKMKLESLAPRQGWDLIILDPVSRLLGVDAEADNAYATVFITLLEELCMDLPGNPTVLFAHHVNKSSMSADEQTQAASRGASALPDGARWQMNLYKQQNEKKQGAAVSIAKEIIHLKMTKSNFTMIHDAIDMKKDFDGFLEIVETNRSSKEVAF